MHDTVVVRELQSFRHLKQNRHDRVFVLDDACLEEFVDIETGQKFLNDIGHAVLDAVVEDQGVAVLKHVVGIQQLEAEAIENLGKDPVADKIFYNLVNLLFVKLSE